VLQSIVNRYKPRVTKKFQEGLSLLPSVFCAYAPIILYTPTRPFLSSTVSALKLLQLGFVGYSSNKLLQHESKINFRAKLNRKKLIYQEISGRTGSFKKNGGQPIKKLGSLGTCWHPAFATYGFSNNSFHLKCSTSTSLAATTLLG